jgi:hypothetical protein
MNKSIEGQIKRADAKFEKAIKNGMRKAGCARWTRKRIRALWKWNSVCAKWDEKDERLRRMK